MRRPHSPAAFARGEPDAGGLARPVRESGPGRRPPERAASASRSDSHYWATDLLEELGCKVHLAHPLGNNWGNRRVKNDTRDAEDLADLLRLGRLAEAWIAPPKVRELRELVRYRAKLVSLRTNCKLQVYAVLAKEGVNVPMTDLFGVSGSELLETCRLASAYRTRVESLRELIEVFDREIAKLETDVRHELRGHAGYQAIQQIPGVGPLFASVFVAEIGDVTRFRTPRTAGELGGAHPEAPRVGPNGAPGPDHQDGMWAPAVDLVPLYLLWRRP